MRINKHVSTSIALTEACKHIDFTLDGPDPAAAEFSTWWNANAVRKVVVSPEDAQDLIDACPADAAGLAWAAQMRVNLAATLADGVRPFDDVILDEDFTDAVYEVEQTLRRTSPLLGIVADKVAGLNDDFTVREIQAYLDDFTPAGVIVDADIMDDNTDADEVLIPWRHIDMLRAANGEMGHVSTRDEVTALVKTVTAEIGEVGDETEGIAFRLGVTVEELAAMR